ncbi:MAG: hypothetical protein JXA74_12670 [Anaerolineae bacterium]|nr:hypothetical protein [Anaerolineae bacterium]
MRSVTQRAWEATPVGWNAADDPCKRPLPAAVLRLWREERGLPYVPGWAVEVVYRMLGPLPMCGHALFPLPILELCKAIGAQRCPELVIGCYRVPPERKILMSYYVFCLDAWLQGADLAVASAELSWRPTLGKEWPTIIEGVYRVLGDRSEIKAWLVQRLVHQLRWWIKATIWHDDQRDRFLLDAYLGDVRGDEARHSAYGNSPYGDPYFAELRLPQMQALEEHIRRALPDKASILERIHSTWLCALKALRYLERIIVEVGAIESSEPVQAASLQCEGTWPSVGEARRWYRPFVRSLDDWLAGDIEARPDLGRATPVKRWLVGLLQLKLAL